jgi:hypothetical protein
LICQDTPCADAIKAVTALGLKSVEFEPFATRAASPAFIETYADVVAEIAAAATSSTD